MSHALSQQSKFDPNIFRGSVFLYPPLDIKNVSKTQIEFPFSLSALNVRKGQSLMLWFWEMFLRPSKEDVTSWSPYETIRFNQAPVLILQGTMDSVVGLETVKAYFEKLKANRKKNTRKFDDLLILLEGGRHAFDYSLNQATFVAADGISAWLHRNL